MWFVSVMPGLLTIITLIAYVFKSSHTQALDDLQQHNVILQNQKEAIARQTSSLQSVIDEKNFLIRIMAHDLKNPLGNIEGVTGLLIHEESREERSRYIEMIQSTSKEANALINKVLQMDESEQSHSKITFEMLDLNEIVRQTMVTMNVEASAKNISISLDGYVEKKISSDPIYIKQIIENLISNAIKFSQAGCEVTVQLMANDDAARIRILDEGPGVPKKRTK